MCNNVLELVHHLCFLLFFFKYLHVHMCMYAHTSAYMQRSILYAILPCFGDRPITRVWVLSKTRLTSQQAPGILLFLLSQCWDHEYVPPHLTFYMTAGTLTWSSCFRGKDFSSWAISSTCPCLLERPSLCFACDSRLRISKPLCGKSACKMLEVWQIKMASCYTVLFCCWFFICPAT